MRDCGSGVKSSIYYWHTPMANGGYYLDYWIFYRYNDWPLSPGFDHEGDWESVTIARSNTATSYTTFDFASFSQHGTWYSYLRENLSCDGGPPGSCGSTTGTARHVTVYVANGSHANYPDECSSLCFQTRSTTPEASHDGDALWENDAQPSALLGLPRNEYGMDRWMGFSGKWGAEGSPSGPAWGDNGTHFYEPGVYECGEDIVPCAARARARSRPRRKAMLRGNDRCRQWFGGSVMAAACTPKRLRAAVAARAVRGRGAVRIQPPPAASRSALRSTASAAGIAQALGRPLRPGQRLRVTGPAGRRITLLVRARTSRYGVGARFERLRFGRSRKLTVVAGRRHGRPTLRVVRAGSIVKPDRGTVTRAARRP
jgi:hypothetical protein